MPSLPVWRVKDGKGKSGVIDDGGGDSDRPVIRMWPGRAENLVCTTRTCLSSDCSGIRRKTRSTTGMRSELNHEGALTHAQWSPPDGLAFGQRPATNFGRHLHGVWRDV